MASAPSSAAILRETRLRAGLTERELAERAGVSESVVADIEQGRSDPSIATLERILAAATVAGTHMLDDVARILSLTPEERLLEVRNVSRFLAAARRA